MYNKKDAYRSILLDLAADKVKANADVINDYLFENSTLDCEVYAYLSFKNDHSRTTETFSQKGYSELLEELASDLEDLYNENNR